MQFGRYEVEIETPRKPLPIEWTEEVTKTITEAYFEQSEKDNSFFYVYGEIYEQEFVVIISYINHSDLSASPISLFISHDIVEDSKKFKSSLFNLVDFSGLVFDDIFATENWNDYNLAWTENEFKGNKFHYKITRENVSLTLQAEEILTKDLKDLLN